MIVREGRRPEPDYPVRIGRYEAGIELGRGFSSIVYQAVDTSTRRLVALKVLAAPHTLASARRQEMANRFEREARAVSALSHPAIVSIFDVGRADDGRQFIAMELLDGETLRSRLDRTGPLLRAEAIPLIIQIADALQYAHGRGIIHRDVKPDNIFLCSDGRAKLMDFGVAHVFADEGLTQTGMVVGSPAYMSPEQINGDTLDGRTDVFSLAVTLVEALTGHKPFDGPNIPAVMNRILNQPPQFSNIVSRPLRRALEQALVKNPQARTPSAGAFAEALRRVMPLPGSWETVTGTQVMALPEVAARRAGSPPWGDYLGWGAITVGVAALAALPFFARSSPAVPAARAARVIVAAAPPPAASSLPIPEPVAPHVSQRKHPAHEKRDGVASQYRITETPVSAEAPITLALLRALRNEDHPARPTAYPAPPVSRETTALADATPLRDDSDWDHGRSPDEEFAPQRPRPVKKAMTAPRPVKETDTPPAVRTAATTLTLPRVLQRSLPLVPDSVAPRSLPATVGLLVSVNESGDVYDAKVTQSSGDSDLDTAALASVWRWRYAPARENGVPSAATIAEQIRFPGNNP